MKILVKHIHVYIHDGDFEEGKHPRSENGQFGSGGSSGSSTEKRQVSVSELQSKLRGMSSEKLTKSLHNTGVDPQIKKHIMSELNRRKGDDDLTWVEEPGKKFRTNST